MTTRDQIDQRFHAELTGALAILRDRVIAGQMTIREFQQAQRRLNASYRAASK
jgi:predicted SpoU family rRNA methylase